PPTEDEGLLESPSPREGVELHKASDSWRALRVLGGVGGGVANLAELRGGVSIFGSARTRPEDPDYQAATETARLLARAGIPGITGGGPRRLGGGDRGGAR